MPKCELVSHVKGTYIQHIFLKRKKCVICIAVIKTEQQKNTFLASSQISDNFKSVPNTTQKIQSIATRTNRRAVFNRNLQV